MIPKKLAKQRDELAKKYDDAFEYTGSYSSTDMDDTYKIAFNAATRLILEDNEILKEMQFEYELLEKQAYALAEALGKYTKGIPMKPGESEKALTKWQAFIGESNDPTRKD